MPGTDFSIDPASPEEAQRISQEILAEMDAGAPPRANGQADEGAGASATEEPPADDGGAQDAPPEDGQPSAREKQPGWLNAIPPALRARFPSLSPDEQKWLEGRAKDGLRAADHATLRQRVAELERVERAFQRIKERPELAAVLFGQRNGNGTGAKPEPREDEATLRKRLFETDDPKVWDETFAKIQALQADQIKRELHETLASQPDSKAARVNRAAAEVRKAYGNDLTQEQWNGACAAFMATCERHGADWRDVDPGALGFLLEPYIESAMRVAPAPKAGASEESLGQPPSAGKTGGRAASVAPSRGAGVPTKQLSVTQRAAREGREPTDDELFEETLRKHGIAGEQELERLRAFS